MKKSNLVIGIIYLLLGLVCLFVSLTTNSKLDSILFGFTGAFIGPGLYLIAKYCYYAKHQAAYKAKTEREQIELNDELKEKLRNKSGRYAYLLGLLVIGAAVPLFVILERLELIKSNLVFIIFLFGYLIFQIAGGLVIYRILAKKYE